MLKFSCSLMVSKISRKDNLSEYPIVYRNLNLKRLKERLLDFICEALVTELITRIKTDLELLSEDSINFYQKQEFACRSYKEENSGQFIFISVYLD